VSSGSCCEPEERPRSKAHAPYSLLRTRRDYRGHSGRRLQDDDGDLPTAAELISACQLIDRGDRPYALLADLLSRSTPRLGGAAAASLTGRLLVPAW
jgi:hypothetical protein